MKLNINIKLFLSALFLLLLSLFYGTNANASAPIDGSAKADQNACGGNGSGTITRPGTTSCELEPDIFKITFLRIDFCTSDPAPPTTGTPLGRASCSTFFKNDDGAEVTVVKGVAGTIGEASDYKMVPYGTYTHGVITMKTTFKYTASVLFNGNMGDTDGNGNTTTCVTKEPAGGASTIIYGFHNSLNAANSNVDCSANAVAEEIIVGVNTVTMDSDNDCNHKWNFTGSSGVVAAYLLEVDGTLHNNVGAEGGVQIDQVVSTDPATAGCTSGTSNGVTQIMGVMALGDPIVVDPSTTGFQMQYNTTQGMRLDMSGTANDMYKFDAAFFDFTIKMKKARARGAWR
jgi:hypothetical protein